MPALSSSNRSQLAMKLEGIYPLNFGVPQAGNGVNLNMTAESLDYTIKNETSKTIRSDRQVPDLVQVSASSQGGFQFEAQYKEFDALLQSIMQSDFVPYGTNGVSAALTGTLTFTTSTITASVAPTGNDAFTNLAVGQWFSVIPPAGASAAIKEYLARRVWRCSLTVAPSATVITLHASTPADTAILTGALATGAKVSSSVAFNGTQMKSYTLEVGHADISQFRQYTGMIPSKLDMKLSVGAIVTGGIEFMGKGFNLLGATSMGTPAVSQTYTPANATRGVFDMIEGGVSISASTYIKSAEFSIDNNLRMQDAVGVFGAAGIGAGTLKISGKLEVYFADAVMYQKVLSGAASSLSIPIVDVDGNGYVYHFPRIKYSAGKVATGGLDQDNMLQMDFEAILNPTAGDPTYQKSIAIYRVGV